MQTIHDTCSPYPFTKVGEHYLVYLAGAENGVERLVRVTAGAANIATDLPQIPPLPPKTFEVCMEGDGTHGDYHCPLFDGAKFYCKPGQRLGNVRAAAFRRECGPYK